MSRVESFEYTTPKTILIAPEVAVAFPVIVTNTGLSADGDGKKIIKAGTPIGGTTSFLTNRQTALQSTNDSTNGENSQGILLHDVDVTDGKNNGTILVAGYVDINKLDITVNTTAQTALTKITFMKGE